MIIDAHVHLGNSIFGYALTPDQLLANMDEFGIDKSVVSPVQPQSYHLEPENDFVAQTCLAHASRLIGFCRVDPRQRERAVAEVKRSIVDLGLKGVFLHPWEEGYPANAAFVVPVVEAAASLAVPVMVATGFPWVSHALQVADLARTVPHAKIIMTNGGQINISGLAQADAYQAMDRHDNLYLETSGVYRQDFIENAIDKYGPERVFFGSNAPRMHQGFELDRALSATKRDAAVRSKVLGESIAALLPS